MANFFLLFSVILILVAASAAIVGLPTTLAVTGFIGDITIIIFSILLISAIFRTAKATQETSDKMDKIIDLLSTANTQRDRQTSKMDDAELRKYY
jgi:membrane protein implicated in regulation of membrane protease activity